MKQFKHVQIISEESEATERNAMYIIPTDETFCKIIIVSSSGHKRTLGFTIPPNLMLTPEQIALLKGDKGDSFTYSDFTQQQLSLLRGQRGLDGKAVVITFGINSNMELVMDTTMEDMLDFGINTDGYLTLN